MNGKSGGGEISFWRWGDQFRRVFFPQNGKKYKKTNKNNQQQKLTFAPSHQMIPAG